MTARRSTLLTLALLAALLTAGAAQAQHDVEKADTAQAATQAARGDQAAAPDHAAGGDGHGGEHVDAALLRGPAEGFITGVTTLVVFVLLVIVLGKFAWGPISGGLKAREDKIRKDIADAEAARAKAEATLREYTARLAAAEGKVRDLLAKATADAETIATNIRARAQQESEEIKERANKDIETARDQAIGQIHNEAVNLATIIAEKILHRNLNPDDQRDLLARSLEQLQTIGRN
jgi:F-type H+-transporting ATPase subunit b